MRVILVGITALAAIAPVDATAGPRVRGAPAINQQVWRAPHADDGYFSDYISGPAGGRTRVRDYPGSATVITRKMMNDFQANNLCDALRFAPGVVATGC
jgi:outer membrane receptor for ferric coprogen and ferric-rhodotorulic acid